MGFLSVTLHQFYITKKLRTGVKHVISFANFFSTM